MFEFVGYALIPLALVILCSIAGTLINTLWMIILGSFKLSIGWLLWNGGDGQFDFPSLIPDSSTSVLAIYYAFLAIALVLFLSFLVINIFRHLSVWGKLDQDDYEKATKNATMGHQFKWFLILFLMTILTPFLIWMVWSAVLAGVFFIQNFLISNTLSMFISKDDFEGIKSIISSDKSAWTSYTTIDKWTALNDFIIQATSTNSDAFKTYLKDILGLTDDQVKLYMSALDSIKNNYNGTAKDLMKQINILLTATYENNPFNINLFGDVINVINKIISFTGININTSTAGDYDVKMNFYDAWSLIFSQNSLTAKASFEQVHAHLNELSGYDDLKSAINNLYEQWSATTFDGLGGFKIWGFNAIDLLNGNNSFDFINSHYAGEGNFLVNDTHYSIYYLTFEKGTESVGIKTCPLLNFCFDLSYGGSGHTFQGFLAWGYGTTTGLILGAITLGVSMGIAVSTGVIGVGLWTFIGVGIGLFFAGLATFFFKVALNCVGILIVFKLILNFSATIFTFIIEILFYFLLLLPACASGALDEGRTYLHTWKQVAGKVSYLIILWGGLLLLSVFLNNINTLMNVIAKSSDINWGDARPIFINFSSDDNPFNTSYGLIGVNLYGCIKFFIAVVGYYLCLKTIGRIGVNAFGQDVYGDLAQEMITGSQVLGVGLGFAMGKIGMATGMAQKAGSAVSAVGDKISAKNATPQGQLKTKSNQMVKNNKKISDLQSKQASGQLSKRQSNKLSKLQAKNASLGQEISFIMKENTNNGNLSGFFSQSKADKKTIDFLQKNKFMDDKFNIISGKSNDKKGKK